jgi:hypothetical protein
MPQNPGALTMNLVGPSGLLSRTQRDTERGTMPGHERLKLARDAYGAYESGDRRVIEELLTDDFTFYSPPDPGIDRATYFERCWPNSELIES